MKRRQKERGSRRGIEALKDGQRKGVKRFSDKAKTFTTRDETWGYEDDDDLMAHGVSSSIPEGLTAEGVTDDQDRGYRDNFFSVKVMTLIVEAILP